MYPFVASPNRYIGRRRPVRLIVLHDMEVRDSATTADAVANMFANPASKVSAHFCVDNNGIIQCVKMGDTAWATPNANADGVQIEQAGFARQSREQWLADEVIINQAARLSAEIVRGLAPFGVHIPLVKLTPDQVRQGLPGFAGHLDCTLALGPKGGHTDPGNQYPWDIFMPKVAWYLAQDKGWSWQ